MKHYENVQINGIEYDVLPRQFALSLQGFPYLLFVTIDDLHCGSDGTNDSAYSRLRVGGKISFDYDSVPSVRRIKNVIIVN